MQRQLNANYEAGPKDYAFLKSYKLMEYWNIAVTCVLFLTIILNGRPIEVWSERGREPQQ